MSAQASQEMISAPGADAIGGVAAPRRSNLWLDNVPVILQIVGAVMALWVPLIAIMIWVSDSDARTNENITQLRAIIVESNAQLVERINGLELRMQESDARLSTQIQELDARLSARIQAMDAKLNAIGDMTLVAFTDGEISSAELAAIWERARDSSPSADEPESE